VHVAVTYDPVTWLATLYENGEPVGSGVLVPVPLGRSMVRVGEDSAHAGDVMAARLDDLRLSSSVRWTEPFEPPTCERADGDTMALWRFEVEDDEEALRDRSEGEMGIRRLTLQDGAARVAHNCEDRTPPPANCRAQIPAATEVCRDTPETCRVRATLGGQSCAALCAEAQYLCGDAWTAPDGCGSGEPLGCGEAAEEAECACVRR